MTDIETRLLPDLLEEFEDGDGHGWATEFEFIRTEHSSRVRALVGSILREGMREPILLGDDGRIWDGHHRLYVAHALGFSHVRVRWARG